MAASNIEHELDKLVQEWASRQRSIYSGKRGCVGHHIYSRKNKLLRWDLRNIAPLTPEEHRLLHDGKIYLEIDYDTQQYLEKMMRMQFRDYLLYNEQTEKEFYQKERMKLKKELMGNFSYKTGIRC